MATDVDVQYFSHLNGLTLGNNWGDLIRLLDTCLVNGLPLTSITSASIDAQGDITLNLYAAHNCMLFQIIELTGFAPNELNGKYRIKGVPSSNQLILKADHVGKAVAVAGTAKLASLGYDIIFRDANDVKRVYRAKNPSAQHPFIRVDESLTSPEGVTGLYNSSYAKYAMVGLLEHMNHIDDYENPDVLQLPFYPADPAKNWKITGSGSGVIRGWCRWHWARNADGYGSGNDSVSPANGNRTFTLCGNRDALYNFVSFSSGNVKQLLGCGLYETPYAEGSTNPNWFLMGPTDNRTAGTSIDHTSITGGWPLMYGHSSAKFLINDFEIGNKPHQYANPIAPNKNPSGAVNSTYPDDYRSGDNDLVSSGYYVMQIPFTDEMRIRGVLKHIHFVGGKVAKNITTPSVEDKAMYVYDGSVVSSRGTGGCYFYLGDIE